MLVYTLENTEPQYKGLLQCDASESIAPVRRIAVWKKGLNGTDQNSSDKCISGSDITDSNPAGSNSPDSNPTDSDLEETVLYLVSKEQSADFTRTNKKYRNRLQSITILKDHITPTALADLLSLQRTRLLEWNLNLVEGILQKENPEMLFKTINEMIDRDFAIVNMDMQYVFFTDGYASSRSLDDQRRLPHNLFQDLVSRKEFHRAALEKGIFYYYTDAVETMDLCHNIFAKDQYVARIVMVLHPGEMTMPKGAEEIFEIYSRHIQELFAHTNILIESNVKGEMQELCQQLLKGQTLDDETMCETLKNFNWKQRDEYQVILFRFNTESGWNAQLYMMLPYLCSVLEGEWPGCFTNYTDTEIFLVINKSCEVYGQNREDPKKGRDSDLQKLAYFVRENSCKAGVSPLFRNFAELRYAYLAASEALTMGMKRKPYLGYFLFNDIRLPYLLQTMKGQLSESILVHPALQILTDYDQHHKSELNKTLFVYLKNNLNMTAAAEELFIHRTSFCRRMNQIRKLTSVKLDDPDEILTLILSYRLQTE